MLELFAELVGVLGPNRTPLLQYSPLYWQPPTERKFGGNGVKSGINKNSSEQNKSLLGFFGIPKYVNQLSKERKKNVCLRNQRSSYLKSKGKKFSKGESPLKRERLQLVGPNGTGEVHLVCSYHGQS